MSNETFYERLDRIERENRIKRIFADRPENLHDYQGCAKDAAESLPAQPEQETEPNGPPTCAKCEDEYNLHDGYEPSKYCDPCAQERVTELEPQYEACAVMLKKLRDFIEFGPYSGTDATNIVIEADSLLHQVAPVEAKEKCPRCESSDKEFRGTCYDGYGEWKCDDKWHEVAEPKSTPSTPTPERVQLALRRIMNRVEVIAEGGTFDVRDSQFIENELLDVWDHHSSKPQPDSSSISSEQSFEDWWANDPVWTTPASLARLAWNAAKGSTEPTFGLHELSAKKLVERAVRGARSRTLRKGVKHPRWTAVAECLALGSTYSKDLCRLVGLDPEEMVKR